jgi:glycosyltransferase involved in cell wall biosynthesis
MSETAPLSGLDLSVIVTVHSETIVGGPTMRAADAAIDAAIDAGFSVERIIALDNATPQTAAYFNQVAFDHWDRVVLEEGDLGRARNAIVQDHVKGDAIAFLDADDLFSENWLAAGMKRLRVAQAAGQRVIVHPEVNWLFDGAASVYWNPEQDDPLFTPYYLYIMNFYDSLCLVPRAAHLEIPYVHRDIPAGLSFQDWQFSIETMAAGWRHAVAPDTIIFKRRRDNSLVTESQGRRAIVRALDAMRIDKIADLGALVAGQKGLGTVAPTDIPAPAALPVPRLGRPAPVRRRHKLLARFGLSFLRPPVMHVDRPDLPDPVPQYGRLFAARVARAMGRSEYPVSARAYKTIRPHFDVPFYLASYPDIAGLEDMDPIRHYLRAGAAEGRDPHPLFSTKVYRARHGDVRKSGQNPFAHWITKGRKKGRISAPFTCFDQVASLLGLSPTEAQNAWAARYYDLRARFEHGELGAQVAKAARFDPLVEAAWPQALQVKIPPFHSEGVTKRLAALRSAQMQAQERPAKAIILVNRPRWGGARRMEGHIADALVARYGAGQVVVISTDVSGAMPAGKFPHGVRYIDLPSCIKGYLSEDFTQRLLVEVMRSLAPEVVFNVNSRTMWDGMVNYGDAIASSMKVVGCFLCNEQTRYGYWTGYPLRRFYRAFDQLWSVCTDSQFLADELKRDYVLPPEQGAHVRVLRGPVDRTIAQVDRPAETTTEPRRPQVFWAGRMDPQKRVDLVYDIAALMPDVDFRMWGNVVMGQGSTLPPKPDNVVLEGMYKSFGELPMEQADLWLYTSAWDGIPQTLLEVGMTGVPLVGSAVGGTPEVLREGLGFTVAEGQGAAAYVTAIRAVLDNPKGARAKAIKLRKMLEAEHTTAAYRATINAVIDGVT